MSTSSDNSEPNSRPSSPFLDSSDPISSAVSAPQSPVTSPREPSKQPGSSCTSSPRDVDLPSSPLVGEDASSPLQSSPHSVISSSPTRPFKRPHYRLKDFSSDDETLNLEIFWPNKRPRYESLDNSQSNSEVSTNSGPHAESLHEFDIISDVGQHTTTGNSDLQYQSIDDEVEEQCTTQEDKPVSQEHNEGPITGPDLSCSSDSTAVLSSPASSLSGSVSPEKDESSAFEEMSSYCSESQSVVSSGSSTVSSDAGEAESSDEDSNGLSNMPLFGGSVVSTDEAVLKVLNLFIKHNLTKQCLHSTLSCVNALLPLPNNMPKSLHTLFAYVQTLCPFPPTETHYYCGQCLMYFGLSAGFCTQCNSNVNHKFFALSLKSQIKNLFEHHNLAKIIDAYEEQRNANRINGMISDVCDGTEYIRARIPGKYNLVLMGHTDGVSVSKSSNTSIYPVVFVICEIPPSLRFKYVLVAGIWCDNVKPNLNMLMKPFVDESVVLYKEGVTWENPDDGSQFTSYVVTPLYCADAPIRSQLQNIVSHTGMHPCNTCEQKLILLPAEPVPPGERKKARRRVFSFQEEPPKLRTAERMNQQRKTTLARRQVTNPNVDIASYAKKGVKGKTVLSVSPACNISTMVFAEYMHLLGIFKQFFKSWFETKATDSWSWKGGRDELNSFLRSVSPPDFVRRLPRSTEDYKKWKASEFRSFLLYYSVIAMTDSFCKEKYIQHWILLVGAFYLLLQESVSQTDTETATILFRLFLRDFSNLYPAKDFTYNLHNFSHLPLITARWGPLWATSTFFFEDFNGDLTKLIHGSREQGKELLNNVQIAQAVALLNGRLQTKAQPKDVIKVQLLNKVPYYTFTDYEKSILPDECCVDMFNVNVYSRALLKGETYTSMLYGRQKKRNNFTVSFMSPRSGRTEYGEVSFYVGYKHASPSEQVHPEKHWACLRLLEVDHLRVFYQRESQVVLKHIIPVRQTSALQFASLENISSKVIRVSDYVCLRPNRVEVNL